MAHNQRPLCHALWKMVLSVIFSYTILDMKKTLSTTECSSGYRYHTKMGIVSVFSSGHQLRMSGENIKLTRPLCHVLWKMVLSVLFSYTILDMEKTLSTTECSSGYR